MIKLMNTVMKKKEDQPEAPVAPEPSDEVKLLSEIRDLLKK
jgi:large-conductance mechanosensitive channel